MRWLDRIPGDVCVMFWFLEFFLLGFKNMSVGFVFGTFFTDSDKGPEITVGLFQK
jgi:hypothetical protein